MRKAFFAIALLIATSTYAMTPLPILNPIIAESGSHIAPVMPLESSVTSVSPRPFIMAAGFALMAVPSMSNNSQQAVLPFTIAGAVLFGAGLIAF